MGRFCQNSNHVLAEKPDFCYADYQSGIARQFFKQAVEVVGHAPETVTTDGHRSYPRAIREMMGNFLLYMLLVLRSS